MSGYPYGNPQYPPPQGHIYPQLYNPVNATPQGQPGQPGFPYQGQYQPGPGYPYQAGQPPNMSYPNVTPMGPSAPPGPGFAYPQYPGVSPTPVYNEPAIDWVATTPANAHTLSNRAVVAGYEGYDGSPLWVIRAQFEADLIPGKLAINHKSAYVPWGGSENAVQDIEVLCARPEKVIWVPNRGGVIVPPNAIVAGNTWSGEPLYVGRAKEQGSLTPGKVHPSHKVLYVSFGGKEIPHKSYEVLCTV